MTIRQLIFYCSIISALLVGQVHTTQATETTPQPFLVSGVIINSHGARLIEHFTQYLSSKSGYPLQTAYVNTYSELSRAMRRNPSSIGWTCGASYVQDSQSMGQQLIAVPLLNHQPTYYSLILTRSDRSEKKLVDFKGGVLAYSDPRSNSGYLSPKYALFKQGIDIDKHFRLQINAGNHEGSITALLNNLADVAAVDEYVWLAYLKSHPQAKTRLHEIQRMGPYPFTPIVAGNKVSSDNIKKITAVLIDMNNDSEGKKILADFYLSGFVEKKPEFYQPISKMLKDVSISTEN